MEVHKHPHHVSHKKKWNEYLLEFFMIFLAVFLGFIAENVRENIADHHKEKEYIISVLQDLRSDTAKLNKFIRLNTQQSKGYDSLISYWYAKPHSDSSVRYIYYLYRKYTNTTSAFPPNRRTIDQLKNAGMALIRNKTASDSIINYYQHADLADKVCDMFGNVFQHEALQTSYRIFDWSVLIDINFSQAYTLLQLNKKFNFLNATVADQNTYIAQIQTSGLVLKTYVRTLLENQQRCLRLITVLEKKYHLE